MKNIRLICILLAVPALLLIPFVAMRFTNEVTWSVFDFILMGVMLLVTGLAIEGALRIAKITWVKVAAVAVILFGFVMVWGAIVHFS